MITKLYEEDGAPRGVAVVGPTASGKTAFSLRLAERFHGEIVSCDSMQIYRGMDIGTAKATPAEQAAAPHHLIDLLPPNAPYSAAEYARDARAAVRAIAARGRLPILCGGTGLYLEAARCDRHGALPPIAPDIRQTLLAEAEERGPLAMHAALAAVDPTAAAAIHPNNLRRTLRALEIYRATGRRKSDLDEESRKRPRALSLLVFGLFPTDREALYARIDRRVDAMVAEGLIDEARALYESGALAEGTTAAQGIGYKELGAAFRGECSLDEAIDEIKAASRHYARRQLTWFRATEGIIPLETDEGGVTPSSCDAAIADISAFLAKR